MKMRQLGGQALSVSTLGLGCMGLSDFYSSSAATEQEGVALILRALDSGVTFLDTSDAYGPHTNEITWAGRSKAAVSTCCLPPSSASCGNRVAPTAASTAALPTSKPPARRRSGGCASTPSISTTASGGP